MRKQINKKIAPGTQGKPSVETRASQGVLYRTEAATEQKGPALSARLLSFLRSRYLFLITLMTIAGFLIFAQTASLQLASTVRAAVGNETGTGRQMTVFAPRGVITDRYGTPLAYNTETRVLYLVNAQLEAEALNASLLDLSWLLRERGLEFSRTLADFLATSPIRFTADMKDVIYWQKTVLGLKEPPAKTRVRFDDAYVKTDPEMLFQYLRDVLFKIKTTHADRAIGVPSPHDTQTRDIYDVMCLRYRILADEWSYRTGTPLLIAEGIDEGTIHILEEQNQRYAGVLTGVEYRRAYTAEAIGMAHVVGYVGAIDSDEYEKLQAVGYLPDAVVGKAGVESSAERYLAGQNGMRPYNVWTSAEQADSYVPETVGSTPVPGNTVRLTIDPDLQKRAMELLRDRVDTTVSTSGAMVVLNVKNGDVLVMASYPSYDIRDFLLMANDEEAAARVERYLTDNVNKPMLNRTIMENYAPGSCFKPCMSAAGLETGLISPYSTIQCTGYIDMDDLRFTCLGSHGWLNLADALRASCNLYYYKLGLSLGIDRIDAWARNFGLGEYSGIDLPGEIAGMRSNPENKRLTRIDEGDKIWNPADTVQSSIGQFDHAYTVLQLARYAGGLATGELVTPHVIHSVTAYDGTHIFSNGGEKRPVGASEATLAAIRTGMVSVCHTPSGAGYRFFKDFPYQVALKTGTAEVGLSSLQTNGLIISYAPADDPEIAIAHVINKDSAGSLVIDMHYEMYKEYFLTDHTAEAGAEEVLGLH